MLAIFAPSWELMVSFHQFAPIKNLDSISICDKVSFLIPLQYKPFLTQIKDTWSTSSRNLHHSLHSLSTPLLDQSEYFVYFHPQEVCTALKDTMFQLKVSRLFI